MTRVHCRNIPIGTTVAAEPEQLSFRPAVYGIILDKDNVLLIPQWDGYDFPGGAIHLGETIEAALEREVNEETGLLVKPTAVLDCRTDFFVDPFTDSLHHSIMIYCKCAVVGGSLSIDRHDEHERQYARFPVWVKADTLHRLKFHNPFDPSSLMEKARVQP